MRRPVNKRKSNRQFKRRVRMTHPINKAYPPRGGYRV